VKPYLKALVTGATGFIGSHLVENLLERGVRVRCLIRKTSDLKWLKNLPIELVHGDCGDKASLREAVKGVDQVFHVAGVTKAFNERTYFEVNALGTENLVNACLEYNTHLQKLVYISSQAAAGPCRNGGRKRESDPCEPVSPYGRSKRMGEELAIAHSHELPILILRPCAVYGPRDRDVYAFFKLLSKRIKPCLSGQDQQISLCFVQDIIQAILLAAEARQPSGEVFFLSDGHGYRLEEIGDIFARAMEVTALCVRIPGWMLFGIASFSEHLSQLTGRPPLLNRGKVEEMVQKNWVCDITKAETLLGFEPRFPLSQGAKLTFEWYRRQNWL
jgi:nucleoside-diphosphate-sugar epimerase